MTRKKVAANELPADVVGRIRDDIARWTATLWQEECPSKPACTCGLSQKASLAIDRPWDGKCHCHS